MTCFKRRAGQVSALLLAFGLAACGQAAPPGPSAAEPITTTQAPTAQATVVTGTDAPTVAPVPSGPTAGPTVPAGPPTVTPSGLQYQVIEPGSGPTPQQGDVVAVHYTGRLENGTVFDSSVERGEPIRFALGSGQVIPGWDEGIALMNQGSKARLTIPPDLAYGESGAGGVIPPNATLIFDVELVEILPGPPAAPTKVEEASYTTTDSGLKYYDLQAGSGAEASNGKQVSVHYTGWLEDGTMFDSSLSRGEPFAFTPGSGQVIPGWEEGVVGMQVGGKRQLVIPADLAYGEAGAGGVIPPNATLIFEVELLDVQ